MLSQPAYHFVSATVVKGHGIASGRSEQSPYPAGSISMQKPHFMARGVALDNCFDGTINLDTAPIRLHIEKPTYYLKSVIWAAGFPAEDFSFVRCWLSVSEQTYTGWIYHPHPTTKIRDFHPATVVEVLAPCITALAYGSPAILQVPKKAVTVTYNNEACD